MTTREKILASHLWLYIRISNTNVYLPYNLPWFEEERLWAYSDLCKIYADGVARLHLLSFEETIPFIKPQYRELARLLILEYQMSIV